MNKNSAFTLVEILIAIAIIVVIVGIANPMLRNIKTNTDRRSSEGNAYTLNVAKDRAILAGDTNPVLQGTNGLAIAEYLFEQGYIHVNP